MENCGDWFPGIGLMVMELIADCGDDFDDDCGDDFDDDCGLGNNGFLYPDTVILLLCCDDGDGLPRRHPVHLAMKRNILFYE